MFQSSWACLFSQRAWDTDWEDAVRGLSLPVATSIGMMRWQEGFALQGPSLTHSYADIFLATHCLLRKLPQSPKLDGEGDKDAKHQNADVHSTSAVLHLTASPTVTDSPKSGVSQSQLQEKPEVISSDSHCGDRESKAQHTHCRGITWLVSGQCGLESCLPISPLELCSAQTLLTDVNSADAGFLRAAAWKVLANFQELGQDS